MKNHGETARHTVSACPKLVQKESKRRQDKLAQTVRWGLCKRHQLSHTQEWCNDQPEFVIENDKVKILWNFNTYVDGFLEAKWPGIIVVDKEEECVIIDIAVPADQNIEIKETEKKEKYQEWISFKLHVCMDFCVTLDKIATETVAMLEQAFGHVALS